MLVFLERVAIVTTVLLILRWLLGRYGGTVIIVFLAIEVLRTIALHQG